MYPETSLMVRMLEVVMMKASNFPILSFTGYCRGSAPLHPHTKIHKYKKYKYTYKYTIRDTKHEDKDARDTITHWTGKGGTYRRKQDDRSGGKT
jgi:hypothetical protein